MAERAPIVDADCHVLEPPDIWTRWLPAKHHDHAPQLIEDTEGGHAWLHDGSPEGDPIGLVSTPGMPYDQFRWSGVRYEDVCPGCYDGAARLVDMDIDGKVAEVLFPPQRTVGHFLGNNDDDFVLAGVDAYNNFLIEEFCAPDPDRLIGVGQIPSLGIDSVLEYLGKLQARGCKSVVIANWPAGHDGITDDDDPFWAQAEADGIPICIHIDLVSRATRHSMMEAARKAGTVGTYGTGKNPRAKAKAVGALGVVFMRIGDTLSQLIFTGVFERFPNLTIAFVETGVGWLPHLLEQLDDRYWRNRAWGELPISEPPSFYFHRNVVATMMIDRTGIAARHTVGVDNIMWSSDYPHHGNDWPYSRKVIDEQMGHLPADEQAKIIGQNATRVFNLDLPAHAGSGEGTAP